MSKALATITLLLFAVGLNAGLLYFYYPPARQIIQSAYGRVTFGSGASGTVEKGYPEPDSSVLPSAARTPNARAVLAESKPVSAGLRVAEWKIVDETGKAVQLRWVNWFGFQGESHVVNGLWKRSYKDIAHQIASLGFNAVRLPICAGTLRSLPVSSVDDYKNPDLRWFDSLKALDTIMQALADEKLYVLVDFHDSVCGVETETPEAPGYTLEDWKNDLAFIAKRYASNSHFIGIDVKNEPHWVTRWGNGDPKTDWKLQVEMASQAILEANPHLLIFVEWIVSNSGKCEDPSVRHEFWGRDLEPINCYPFDPAKLPPDRLVLSPHVYGPGVSGAEYFDENGFPENLRKTYDVQLGQFVGKYAIAIGEFGGDYERYEKDRVWQDFFVSYLKEKGITNFFYWSWNPNSTNTKGIVLDDWQTVEEKKYESIRRLFEEE